MSQNQNDFESNNYFNDFNDPLDNIFLERTPNFPKSKSSFQITNLNSLEDEKNINFKKIITILVKIFI